MLLPHFVDGVPLTVASMNALRVATGTEPLVPAFIAGENPVAKLDMVRVAAGLALSVPAFTTAGANTLQLNLLVDVINALPGVPAIKDDPFALVSSDTVVMNPLFQRVPSGELMLTVGLRRATLTDFLATGFEAMTIRGIGPGLAIDAATGFLTTGAAAVAVPSIAPAMLATDGTALLSPVDGAPLLSPTGI